MDESMIDMSDSERKNESDDARSQKVAIISADVDDIVVEAPSVEKPKKTEQVGKILTLNDEAKKLDMAYVGDPSVVSVSDTSRHDSPRLDLEKY